MGVVEDAVARGLVWYGAAMDAKDDKALQDRLLAASYALPVQEALQDLADDIDSCWADGVPEEEIDRRGRAWLEEHLFPDGPSEMEQLLGPFLTLLPGVDPKKLYDALGIETWALDCAKNIARTGEPLPFYPLSGGFYFPVADQEFPVLVCVTTPLTDIELASRQMVKQHKKLFGTVAPKRNKLDEVDAARMLAMHRQGMSYREIAIQNLRDDYPDITASPYRYRDKITTERNRVAKRIAALQKVWNERGV